jgi:hypothetical protein
MNAKGFHLWFAYLVDMNPLARYYLGETATTSRSGSMSGCAGTPIASADWFADAIWFAQSVALSEAQVHPTAI